GGLVVDHKHVVPSASHAPDCFAQVLALVEGRHDDKRVASFVRSPSWRERCGGLHRHPTHRPAKKPVMSTACTKRPALTHVCPSSGHLCIQCANNKKTGMATVRKRPVDSISSSVRKIGDDTDR